MVQNAPASCHAAGGDNDLWHDIAVKALGIVCCVQITGNSANIGAFFGRGPADAALAAVLSFLEVTP